MVDLPVILLARPAAVRQPFSLEPGQDRIEVLVSHVESQVMAFELLPVVKVEG
jgi:hypothetical protein